MKRKSLLFLLMVLCIGLLPRITNAETYDGEYSIDYLLRNYNVVTFGHKHNLTPFYNYNDYYGSAMSNGNIMGINNIEGAVLVAGDYMSPYYNTTFGTNAGTTKSFIKGTKGDNVTTTSSLVTNTDYLDFNKMYAQVMSESNTLADNTEYHINSAKLEVSKPGVYSINNTADSYEIRDSQGHYVENNQNTLIIKNYDKDSLYIFNVYDVYVRSLIPIVIMENNSPTSISLYDFIESGKYTGNIIFNYPNAKYIYINNSYNNNYNGSIIAPNADVEEYYNSYMNENSAYLSLIVNSIEGRYQAESYLNIKKIDYSINKKISSGGDEYFKELNDYNDDYYSRDYSIKDLLENYSLVTLGHKVINPKSKLLQFGNKPGSVRMFHITGQALIAGDLYGKTYDNEEDYLFSYLSRYDRTAFDLESNKVTESYIKGNVFQEVRNISSNSNVNVAFSVIQPWDNMTNDNIIYLGKKNKLYISNSENKFDYRYSGIGNFSNFIENYINFDRLYDNIVAEQSAIDEGKEVKNGEDKVTHIPIGGNYVIEDINDINEIVFDNFDEEKDKLTIITVKNEGDINFPLISKDTGSYKGIVTNDYYGKTKATHLYEQDTFVQDSYHGNIVWNIPNATYIKLKENAPFAGHLIAPNADVETPETHFAGCFIVNSIYGEGNTEAHFYPLTATATYDVPEYDDLTPSELSNLSNMRLKRLLGGKGSIIETTIIGDEAEFKKEEAKLNVLLDKEETKTNNSLPPIIDILQNPLTKSSIFLIISILSIIGFKIINLKKEK